MEKGVDLKAVDVVVGIILKGGKFLAEKRMDNDTIDPGLVCLPGGHVESEETKEEALIREMKEELNIVKRDFKLVKKDFWTASNGEIQNVHYYIITDYTGNPICNVAKQLVWLTNIEKLDTKVDRNVMKEVSDGF